MRCDGMTDGIKINAQMQGTQISILNCAQNYDRANE